MHQMKNFELSNKIIKMKMYLTANYPQLKKKINKIGARLVSRKYSQMKQRWERESARKQSIIHVIVVPEERRKNRKGEKTKQMKR